MIKIGNRSISEKAPVFIIAEAGVNHNGSLRIAKKLIEVAAECGADAVKFQTFDPDTLVTKMASKALYQKINEKKENESQYTMLKRLKLNRSYHKPLQLYAKKRGIIFLSTPFSIGDIDFLDWLGVPAFKAGSTDMNNIPHLRHMAKKKKPIILSSGMATLSEIETTVHTIKKEGNKKIILLHCTSQYPTPAEDVNIRAMVTLAKKFRLQVGFSDHTVDATASISAVALGARVIEKHFTLDKKMMGPDHKVSLSPVALKKFITNIRATEKMLGSFVKKPTKNELKNAKFARKSIVTLNNISKGETLTTENIGLKRPGTGIPPSEFYSILGKKAKKNIKADILLTRSLYEK